MRKVYDGPKQWVLDTQIDYLDEHCQKSISLSRFLLLGTEGDILPKGYDPGFVRVLDGADDDTAIACFHRWVNRPHHVDVAEEFEVPGFPPCSFDNFAHIARLCGAGFVDEDVEAARGLGQGSDVFGTKKIG